MYNSLSMFNKLKIRTFKTFVKYHKINNDENIKSK